MTREFLEIILPYKGWYIGHAIHPTNKDQHHQQVFGNLDDLIRWLERYSLLGWNVYHAVASFQHPQGTWNGQAYEHPRGQDNALALRVIPLDIDTRDSKPNAKIVTRRDAIKLVMAFCYLVNIPLPLFVNSGGGIHCYWVFEHDLDVETWWRLANGLYCACIRHKLEADHKITRNCAAVLRTPGFPHQITGNLVTVAWSQWTGYVTEDQFAHLLTGEERANRNAVSARTTQSRPSNIAGAISSAGRDEPSDPEYIRINCRQVGQLLGAPSEFREPMHHALVGLFVGIDRLDWYIEHGGDPEWRDKRITYANKWNPRYSASRCRNFWEQNPEGCEGCAFFDQQAQGDDRFQFSSPAQAGRITPGSTFKSRQALARQDKSPHVGTDTAEKAAPPQGKMNGHHFLQPDFSKIDISPPFEFRNGQLVLHETAADPRDDKFTVVSHNAIYLEGVHRSEAGASAGCSYAFNQWLPHEGWVPITVAAGALYTADAIKHLADGGANILEPNLFKRHVQIEIDRKNTMMSRTPRFEQCGWKKDPKTGEWKFLLGQWLVGRNSIEQVVVSDDLKHRAQWIGPAEGGNIHDWRANLMELIPPYATAMQYTVLLALGAVLMSFLGSNESGGTANQREIGSGTGKTTGLQAGCSIWSQWDGLALTNYDTGASQGYVMSMLCNLPVMSDELADKARHYAPTMLRDAIVLNAEGRDKLRMTDGGRGLRHVVNRWNTIFMSASNLSCIDIVRETSKGTNAALMRLQEYTSKTTPHLSPSRADEIKREMFSNAGHAGIAFLQHILQDNLVSTVQRLLDWEKHIYNITNFTPANRFIVRQIACAAAAGEISDDIGLLPFKSWPVIQWAIKEQKADTKVEREDDKPVGSNGIEAMSRFLSDYGPRCTLHVANSYVFGVNQPALKLPSDKLLIRYERIPMRAIIPVSVFRSFCVKEGYSCNDCLNQLTETGFVVAREAQTSLGAGVSIPTARQRCLILDMTHPIAQHMPSFEADSEQPSEMTA